MKKILVSMFLLVFGLCLVGCTIVEFKTFTIALRDGLYFGKTDDDHEIYIEFNQISRMEYVKTNSENCMKDLYTKDEQFYTPYRVSIVLTKGIYNTVLKFEDMVANDSETTTTYKLSKISDDEPYDIKEFKVKLVDNDNDALADQLNLSIESNLINNDNIELNYLPGSETYEDYNKYMIRYALEYDETLKVIEGHYTDENNIAPAGTNLSFYVQTSSDDKKVLMYVNGEQYGNPLFTNYQGEECYKFEYMTGYTDVDIKFKEVHLADIHEYIDGMCDCGAFDEIWLNENFDLSDEKILFKGSVNDEFTCDIIILTLKHTTTYIELSKRHFGIDCITEVEYLGGPRPPEYFFEEEYRHLLESYNQIVFLHVDVQSKSEIIDIIKELEKLESVRSANFDFILHFE